MKLVKITERSGVDTYVNLDQIISVKRGSKAQGNIEIKFASGDVIYANDSIEDFVNRVAKDESKILGLKLTEAVCTCKDTGQCNCN